MRNFCEGHPHTTRCEGGSSDGLCFLVHFTDKVLEGVVPVEELVDVYTQVFIGLVWGQVGDCCS